MSDSTSRYQIEPGDDIASVAYRAGLTPETVLRHNPELRKSKDPMVLAAGERVVVPDVDPGECPAETDRRHHFLVDRSVRLRVEFREEGSPLAFQPFQLDVGGVKKCGHTDRFGRIDLPIKPTATIADVCIGTGTGRRHYILKLGQLEPVSTIRGMQARLANLGFAPGPINGINGDSTRAALRRFQLVANLEPSGQADDQTLARLLQLHQS